MKREKYTVSIQATLTDELGDYAGEVQAGDTGSVSCDEAHVSAAVALQASLKAAYQRWLDASDDELDAGVANAMATDKLIDRIGKAAECNDRRTAKLAGDLYEGQKRKWTHRSYYKAPFVMHKTDAGNWRGRYVAGLDATSEFTGAYTAAYILANSTPVAEPNGDSEVATLKARIAVLEGVVAVRGYLLDRAEVVLDLAAERDGKAQEKARNLLIDIEHHHDGKPIVRTQNVVQVGDVRDNGGEEEVMHIAQQECKWPVHVRYRDGDGEWYSGSRKMEEMQAARLLNPTDEHGKPLPKEAANE